MTLKDESYRSVGVQYSTGEEQEMAPERVKRLSQRGKDTQLWMCLVVKVKSNAAVKKDIGEEPGMLSP